MKGQSYQHRRYSRFLIQENGFHKLKKKAFIQYSAINTFAGDILRNFEELDEQLMRLPSFHALLDMVGSQAIHLLCAEDKHEEWGIELGVHQIRIGVQSEECHLPAPEGIHQDGFDLVSVLCIKRDKVTGGHSQLFYGPHLPPFFEKVLNEQEFLLFNDRILFHHVTPTTSIDGSYAHRDMFVITAKQLKPSDLEERYDFSIKLK